MFAKKALSAAPSAVPVYIEDAFSTYLYTGTDATRSITNGIDLSTKGGMVWVKSRTSNNGADNHQLSDTVRGYASQLATNTTGAETTEANRITAFNSNGFSLGGSSYVNDSNETWVSWTFAKQAKFFDVVTYTGNGTARTISHNLGSVPGCIIVKRTDTTGDWQVYHRANTANPETDYLVLNSTAATADSDTRWNDTLPTSTVFSLGTDATVNANGGTYVAYLFAHDAGGFGASGSDNVITCGSFTHSSGTDTSVTLGYEPQWLLIKSSSASGNWFMVDNMRGLVVSGDDAWLTAQSANAENNNADIAIPQATGFSFPAARSGGDYIYIAIRRGPMKTPEAGTEVFTTDTGTNGTNGGIVTTGFPVDMCITDYRSLGATGTTNDRLRGFGTANSAGVTPVIETTSTSAESSFSSSNPYFYNAWNTTITRGSNGANPGGAGIVTWFFKRAPGFFDVVCYTGTGSNTTVTHNLGVVPELMIVKNRSDATGRAWAVYAGDNTDYLVLNTNAATADDNTYWNDTSPTSTVFSVGTNNSTNESGDTFVAYLFASLTGVSKVGSYTGNGSNQTINCGFTAGARFILIKRTDSTGDWYVYDSARGIVSGNDPQLKINTTDAEATGYDAIDPDNSGFIVNNDATNFPINVNNATYIYLAIA